MLIPTKLKIGGHEINVVMKELDEETDGEWDCIKNTIFIDSRLPQTHREATLFHEILHVCNATWAEGREGHTLLESISQQYYQVMKDNNLLRE